MHPATSRTRPIAVFLALALVLLAGCSASGGGDGDNGGGATTTTAATGRTEDDGDETTTTTEDDGGDDDPVTSEDLEAVLPIAADLGDGWTEDESGDEEEEEVGDEPIEVALEEQCPDAAAFTNPEEDDDTVARSFVSEDDEQVDVELSPSAAAIDDDELQQQIDAINDCGEITFDDDGMATTVVLDATSSDDFGDQAMLLELQISLSPAESGQTFDLTSYLITFRNGDLGAELFGVDGIDARTNEIIPFDPDLLLTLASDIDPQLAALPGGG